MKPATDSHTTRSPIGPLAKTLYLMATLQIVIYYLVHVPPYIQMLRYEKGMARMPFQGRLLMMIVLRWAHYNRLMIGLAAMLGRRAPWFIPHISPESIVQLGVNAISIAVTGLVATRIYCAGSRERLLTPFVYPLVLVMCVVTYILHTTQDVRFFYDLPSLMFVSAGMYCIYFRWNPAWLVLIFVIGTINRETTLFLLAFYVLRGVVDNGSDGSIGSNYAIESVGVIKSIGYDESGRSIGVIDWRRLMKARIYGVVVPLALFWCGWRIWIGWIFRYNSSEYAPHLSLNFGLLLWPLAWPQLLSAGCYLAPIVLCCRRFIFDPALRVWLWILPLWLGVMFFYGILVETRIFGELIAYLACVAALIAEEFILACLKARGWLRVSAGGASELIEGDGRLL